MKNRKHLLALLVGVTAALSTASISICAAELAPSQSCVEAATKLHKGIAISDASAAEEKLYREAIALCPSMPDAHHNLGVVLQKQGKSEPALEEFQKALTSKESAESRLALAHIFATTNRSADAEREYQRVIELEPKNVKAFQGLAALYARNGSFERSLELLAKALSVDSANAATHFSLAAIQERLGQLDAALGSYTRALELRPSDAEAALFLGLLYVKLGKLDEAERTLNQGVTQHPESADLQRSLGVVFQQAGDLERAELALRKATTLAPDDISAQTDLAFVLIAKKQEGLALEILKTVTTRESKNARALSALGLAQLALGKLSEAEANLKLASELDPLDPAVHHNLGVLYQRTGRSEDAKREFAVGGSSGSDGHSGREN